MPDRTTTASDRGAPIPTLAPLRLPVDDRPSKESAPALPAALCMAAAEVITEKGLGGFSLREVARRAGVSHAAPGYHFGDTRGLLTAMAVQGLQTLAAETGSAAAREEDPVEKLVAIARTYVRVAMTYPAHCEVIWREDLINAEDPAYGEAGSNAYGVLVEAIQAIAADRNPDLAINDAALLCWSSVQGQVALHAKLRNFAGLDQVSPEDAAGELAERMTRLTVAGFDRSG